MPLYAILVECIRKVNIYIANFGAINAFSPKNVKFDPLIDYRWFV